MLLPFHSSLSFLQGGVEHCQYHWGETACVHVHWRGMRQHTSSGRLCVLLRSQRNMNHSKGGLGVWGWVGRVGWLGFFFNGRVVFPTNFSKVLFFFWKGEGLRSFSVDKHTHALCCIQTLPGSCKEGVSVNKHLPESKWISDLQRHNFYHFNNKHLGNTCS